MAGQKLRRATREQLQENPDLYKHILARIAGAWDEEGLSEPEKPAEICRKLGLSYGAFLTYLQEDQQRYEMWQRALETRAQLYAEETIDIADEAEKDTAHLAKLKIDARHRIIKAWNKRLYGDDPMIQINQVVTDPTQVAAKIVELEKRLGLRADEPETVLEALPAPSAEVEI